MAELILKSPFATVFNGGPQFIFGTLEDAKNPDSAVPVTGYYDEGGTAGVNGGQITYSTNENVEIISMLTGDAPYTIYKVKYDGIEGYIIDPTRKTFSPYPSFNPEDCISDEPANPVSAAEQAFLNFLDEVNASVNNMMYSASVRDQFLQLVTDHDFTDAQISELQQAFTDIAKIIQNYKEESGANVYVGIVDMPESFKAQVQGEWDECAEALGATIDGNIMNMDGISIPLVDESLHQDNIVYPSAPEPEVPDTSGDGDGYFHLTPESLELLVTQILGKVNERIAGRIVQTIDENSDINHVPSALAVFNFLRTMTPAMTCEPVTGSIESVTEPSTRTLYLQRDDEEDQTWVMYLWIDGKWVAIGDTTLDLVNYWSKSDADVAELRQNILDTTGIDLIKGALDYEDLFKDNSATKAIILNWIESSDLIPTAALHLEEILPELDKVYVRQEDHLKVLSNEQIISAVNNAFANTDPRI